MAGNIRKGIFVDFRFSAVKGTLKGMDQNPYIVLLPDVISDDDKSVMENCGFGITWIHAPSHSIIVDYYAGRDNDRSIFQIAIVDPKELNLFKLAFNDILVAYKKWEDL